MTILDLSYLIEITDGNPDVMTEMIQLVVDETPRQISGIKTNIQQQNWEKVRAEAHKVKPIFLYVGLTGLNEKMQDIEDKAANEQNAVRLQELIDEIEETFDEIVPQLKKRMADISS